MRGVPPCLAAAAASSSSSSSKPFVPGHRKTRSDGSSIFFACGGGSAANGGGDDSAHLPAKWKACNASGNTLSSYGSTDSEKPRHHLLDDSVLEEESTISGHHYSHAMRGLKSGSKNEAVVADSDEVNGLDCGSLEKLKLNDVSRDCDIAPELGTTCTFQVCNQRERVYLGGI